MVENSQLPLAEFLLARIDEDEAEAREYQSYQVNVYEAAGWWDCDRVLAECEAKRRIVELHNRGHECPQYDHTGEVDSCTYVHDFEACSTLRLLAQLYAAHPDYRPEWRP